MQRIVGLFILTFFMFNYTFSAEQIKLPSPKKDSNFSLERAIYERKSRRSFSKEPLSIEQLSQILWASYGKNKYNKITSPSAGALYPLKIYVVALNVDGLKPGLYRYEPADHLLTFIFEADLKEKLGQICFGQQWVKDAAANIIICADYEITTSHYGERGRRYVDIEVGHAGQNIYLEAEALGLGTVAVGAFDDKKIKSTFKIKEEPLYIMPVGRRNE